MLHNMIHWYRHAHRWHAQYATGFSFLWVFIILCRIKSFIYSKAVNQLHNGFDGSFPLALELAEDLQGYLTCLYMCQTIRVCFIASHFIQNYPFNRASNYLQTRVTVLWYMQYCMEFIGYVLGGHNSENQGFDTDVLIS